MFISTVLVGSSRQVPPSQILMNQMKILHLQAPDGNRHPAILVAMIVHRTRLPDLPANGHQFVKRSAVDEIAGVVLPVPVQVRSERIGADGRVLQKAPHWLGRAEGRLGQLPQSFDECLNGNRFYCGGHCGLRRKSIAQSGKPESQDQRPQRPRVTAAFPRSEISLLSSLRHRGIHRSLAPPQIPRQLRAQQPQSRCHRRRPRDRNQRQLRSNPPCGCHGPDVASGTIFATSKLIAPATTAVTAAFPNSPQRNSPSGTSFL